MSQDTESTCRLQGLISFDWSEVNSDQFEREPNDLYCVPVSLNAVKHDDTVFLSIAADFGNIQFGDQDE